MDNYGLTKEILALVDASPMNDIQLEPLIEKYTVGLSLNEEREVRSKIIGVLYALKRDTQINFTDSDCSLLNTTSYGEFITSSLVIRSTWERQKELDAKKDETKISIGGHVVNSMVGSHRSEQALIKPKSEINNNTTPKISWGTFIIKHIYWVTAIVLAIVLIVTAIKKC